ncbi:acyltransferase [Lachnoanaerobaculum orale]|uniref:Acyltransferase n=1 Tax=Lachnoanaerobaculum orale TaxID=979627 RepID=A0A3P3QA70_9FIRM|nr:acyltransferase family protein [Lachnoanaerobaculum orale]RRJ17240.1 acyltransferase [Lachnoanaerobaculum orale]
MDNLFLTVLLIVGIVILAIPQSVSKTVKKALPILLVFLAVSAIAFLIKGQGSSTIQIVASNDQNEKAEGNEIFLKEVIVNGESKKPGDIFSKGWIEKDGGLLWRSYDRIDGMKDSIQAEFQNGEDVVLVLKQNKWQGKARIISVQGDQGFDGYTDSESEGWMNFEVKLNTDSSTFLTRKNLVPLAVIIWVFLVAISLISKRFFPEQKRENKDRLIGLDLLKIVSAFMIAVIHASSGVFNNHELGSLVWKEGLVLNAATRFAVPVFLMISGALLLGRKISLDKAIRKAIIAGIALFVWSFAFILTKKILWNDGNVIHDTLMIFFNKRVSGHLWYGYLLIWIYLFSPILNIMYESLSNKMRIYFIILGLLIPSAVDSVIYYFSLDVQILQNSFFIYMNLGYISVLFIGRMIYENKEKIPVILGGISSVIGLVLTILLTEGISRRLGVSTHTFFSELEIGNVMYAFGIMLLGCKLSWKGDNTFIKKIIIKVSELAMGIYFSHALVMWLIGDTISFRGITFKIDNSVPECLLFVVIIFVTTIIMIAPLANIPYLKKLVKIS